MKDMELSPSQERKGGKKRKEKRKGQTLTQHNTVILVNFELQYNAEGGKGQTQTKAKQPNKYSPDIQPINQPCTLKTQ